jgi:Tfp pilus assembly protein PilF
MNEFESDSDATLDRASMLCDLRRHDEAATLVKTLIAREPQNPQAWCMLAVAELGRGDKDAAHNSALAAIAVAPELEWAHRLASISTNTPDRRDEAIRHARDAVRLAPDQPSTLICLARALAHNPATASEARRVSDAALTIAPNSPDTNFTVGTVAAADGRRADAEAAFLRTLQINPEHSAAHNELARLKLKKGSRFNADSLAQAATGFATAVGTDPRSSVSRKNLDLVVRSFLSRVAYLIFLDAYLIVRITNGSSNASTRSLPLVLLLLPVIFAWRFVAKLNRALRSHLRAVLTHEHAVTLPATLMSVAASCIIASVAGPANLRQALAAGAAATALVARVVLHEQVARISRSHHTQSRPAVGTPLLAVLAVLLLLLGFVAAATSLGGPAGPAGIPVALIAVAGGIYTARIINRRRTTSN